MPDAAEAAFRTRPFTVDVGEHSYTFPHRDAAWWMDVLSCPDWIVQVLHQVDETSYRSFVDRAENGTAGPDELRRVACAVLAEAAGRRWWEAYRLAHVCRSSTAVTGAVLLRGIDPSRLTLSAFLSVVWAVIVQNKDDMGRAQLEMELTMPPPETADEEPEELDMNDLVARMRNAPGVSVG